MHERMSLNKLTVTRMTAGWWHKSTRRTCGLTWFVRTSHKSLEQWYLNGWSQKDKIPNVGIHKLQGSTEFFTLETSTLIPLDCEVSNNPVATYQQMQGREYTE